MRRAAILVLLAASPATADRTMVTLGGTFGVRDTTANAEMVPVPEPLGGGRLTLSFGDYPAAFPVERDVTNYEGRLVPELRVGFLANDVKAEGELGAGLRGELQLSTLGRKPFWIKIRVGLYAAARAEVIGANRDPAAEFALGDYVWFANGRGRVGIEGGMMLRRQMFDGMLATKASPVWTIYLGWAL